MKKTILTLFVNFALISLIFGQNALIYTEVIPVDSVSRDELFNRAKIWFVSAYNNSSEVLQIVDSENGQLVGKALFKFKPISINSSDRVIGNIKYAIKISVKEGRYKYEVTDFIHQPTGNSNYGNIEFGLLTTDEECPYQIKGQFKKWVNDTWLGMKKQTDSNIIPLIANLKEGMLKKTETKKDDW
jgi:hypothetical protein